MNRSKSVVLQRNLPFTINQFQQLKSKVTSQIALREKHRYLIPQEKAPTLNVQFSKVPSRLQSSLTCAKIVTKYNVVLSQSPKSLSLFQPWAKVRCPSIKNYPPSVSGQLDTQKPLNLMRFKRILYSVQTKLCRTCQGGRSLKPKLFKKRN